MPGRRLLLAVAASAVLAAAGAGLYLWAGGEPAGPQVGTFRGERGSEFYAPIGTRERDPRPLTEQEVFGPATESLTAAGVTLLRRSVTGTADCATAVTGERQAAALRGCSQVLRAGYEAADGTVAGQFAVFNLPDAAAADALVAALDPAGGEGFLRPLPGRPGAFDTARSWAQVRALGHYVTVSWVGPVGQGPADLTGAQLALETLGRAIHRRLVAAG